MKFEFSAKPTTPAASSVLHFEAKRYGATDVRFDTGWVKANYEGSAEDLTCKQLIDLFENFETHVITLSSK